MSDTVYANVTKIGRLIDLVDNEWVEDSLSDDGKILL